MEPRIQTRLMKPHSWKIVGANNVTEKEEASAYLCWEKNYVIEESERSHDWLCRNELLKSYKLNTQLV